MSLDLSLSLYRTQKAASAPAAFTPDDLSNPFFWYDFTDNSTITTAGGSITAVSDKFAATSNDAADETNSPTHVSGSNMVTSGSASEGIFVPATFGATTEANLFIVVDTSDTAFLLLSAGNNGSTYAVAGQSGSSTSTIDSNVGTPSYRLDGSAVSFSTRGDVYTQIADGSKHIVAIIGADYPSGIQMAFGDYSNNTAGFSVAANWYEIICVTGTMPTSERDDLENYLANKHSITI